MSTKLTLADVQRIAEAANNPNPLVAAPARKRIAALAPDSQFFADNEAWLWAQHLCRVWVARGT
jgi:hypothetical protein